jgi:hypothetical protein
VLLLPLLLLLLLQSASAELLEDEGPRRKWRLDYQARWSFWKVSGICENRWEGCWRGVACCDACSFCHRSWQLDVLVVALS